MNKDIKLIVCDIDGTILPEGRDSISDKLRESFYRAMDKGYKVMINTGRHYTFLPESLFRDLPMDRIGTISGACLTDRNGKTLTKRPMGLDTMNLFVEMSDKYNIGLGFKFEDAVVVYANRDKFLDGYCGQSKTKRKLVMDDSINRTHHLTYGTPLGTFLIGDEETIEPIKKDFPDIVFAWSKRKGYDAFLSSITKVNTVEDVLKEYGYSWDNVIAFGDAGNDTAMIQKAGIGVAMGNSKDDVKEYADIIADTCINDGVSKVLEELEIA